jgi:CMP-N,N'-diacetyllegionaminic acid synthase
MKIVSLILARGGSKGIPNKNIIDVNGRPLIDYVIKASNLSIAHETWVSTNCDKIKRVAETLGAKTINRPNEISKDDSKNEEAIEHFLKKEDCDIIVSIQPTSPLILAEDINKGINLVKSLECDSCFSATEKHWTPYWDHNMEPIEWYPENRPFRQQKNITYEENGAFYITTKKNFEQTKLRYGGRIMASVIPLSRSFQIDSLEDLDLVRIISREQNLYNSRNRNKPQRKPEHSEELDRYLKSCRV